MTKTSNKRSQVSGRGLSSLGSAPRAERGIALIVTLFVIALLTVLVLEYHFDAVIEIDMAANYADDVRAHHLALAGVQFAHALLQVDDPKSDGPEDAWYTLSLIPTCTPPQQLLELVAASGVSSDSPKSSPPPFPSEPPDNRNAQETQSNEGCVSLRIIDESGKLPINALTSGASANNTAKNTAKGWKTIFQKFFDSFGIDKVVGALTDWVDAEGPEEDDGAEQSYYDGLATPYKIRNGPMRMPGELRLIKGFDAEALAKLFPGMTPQAVADVDLGSNHYLTPYSEMSGGRPPPKVNLNTADPAVLRALIDGLPGGDSCNFEEIVLKQQQAQFKSVADACSALGTTYADVKSTHFRIEALGQVGAIQKKAVAVVKRVPPGAPPGAPMVYFKIE